MFQMYQEKVNKIGKGNGNDNTVALSIVICVGRVMVDQMDLILTMPMPKAWLMALKMPMKMAMKMAMVMKMLTGMPKAMAIRMTMGMAMAMARLSKRLVGGFSLQRPEASQEHGLY